MDRQRFDNLTRLFATSRNRREAIRLVLGGILAGGAAASLRTSASAQVDCVPVCESGQLCNAVGDCVEGCQTEGACTGQADCCIGHVCTGDQSGANCVPTCQADPGLGCSPTGLDCCSELNLTCVEGSCCRQETGFCSSSEDCCGGLNCISGECTVCLDIQQSCAGDGDCCGGLLCDDVDGTCCYPNGAACPIGSDCCGDSTCTAGVCCMAENEACAADQDCCGDLVCPQGTCASPVLCLAEGATCDPGNNQCCGELECTDLGQGFVCFECIPEGEPCETIGCCNGLVCNEFMTACVPLCQHAGETCGLIVNGTQIAGGSDQLDCCDGLVCCDGDPSYCADCCGDFDCPKGEICCAGVCREIECCIDDILVGLDPNRRCPDKCTCFEGLCVDGNQEHCDFCHDDRDCPKDTCCCKDGRCASSCCAEPGCDNDRDCAKGSCCCHDGSCAERCCKAPGNPTPPPGVSVDQLPNTGSGDGNEGLNLVGKAALGAAAAYIAGKRLREGGAENAIREAD